MKSKRLTRNEVVELLREMAKGPGGQTALACRIGCRKQYISDVLRERRPPGPRVLKALGLRRLTEEYE
jgi:transcriptional regulator with XRE-family HTH domain